VRKRVRERETLHTKQNNINNKNIMGEEGPAGESERARERERGKSAGKRFLRGEKKNLFSPFVFFLLAGQILLTALFNVFAQPLFSFV